MKTQKLLLTGLLLLVFGISKAQVSVNVNIGTPAWAAPVTVQERYYYLPDINTYYDMNNAQYVYVNRGQWVRTRNLPVVYRNYDFNRGPKVIVANYRGNSPYLHYKHKPKYNKHYKNDHKGRNHGHQNDHRGRGRD